MEFKRVKIASLKPAAHNPASRLTNSQFKQLVKSIERMGLIYPIAVDKSMNVIDGHRRLAACKKLGWTEIPIIIPSAEATSDELYAEVNANSWRLNGGQNLAVWLVNPAAVTKSAASRFENLQEQYGRVLLKAAIRGGASANLFRHAGEAARYVGMDGDIAFHRRAARWLLQHRTTAIVHSYMKMQLPPKQLFNAIKSNKTLAARYVAA